MKTFLTTLIPDLYRRIDEWDEANPVKDGVLDSMTITHPKTGNVYQVDITQTSFEQHRTKQRGLHTADGECDYCKQLMKAVNGLDNQKI